MAALLDIGTINAPAKINLCLHIVGQRDDGYHLLDSLVAPVGVHDTIFLRVDEGLTSDTISVDGTSIDAPAQDNLVLRAVAQFRSYFAGRGHGVPNIAAHVTKVLPVASGMGGGSSDAVAALKLLAGWAAGQGNAVPNGDLAELALALGADCPLFLQTGPSRMRGIGEQLSEAQGWGGLHVVLVNPKVPVSTPDIFKRLTRRHHKALPELPAPSASHAVRLAWLRTQTRNDLQPPAIALEPVIEQVLKAIEGTTDCDLVRMSGSGATCFGIYSAANAAQAAADRLRAQHPDWWVVATHTLETMR